jgi:hypothetical protein
MIASNPANSVYDFPDLTAAQIAAALARKPSSIRRELRATPATGTRVVGGNDAQRWNRAALPDKLRGELIRRATAGGFASVGEMFRTKLKAWTSPVPLSEVSDECADEAAKLRAALGPSLGKKFVVSQADYERDGVADYEKVFGHKISTRHFRQLISRTIARDGGREDWSRLELYLPKKPARKPAATEPEATFPFLAQAINEREPEEVIFKEAFRAYAEMTNGVTPGERERAKRQLRDFLFERVPAFARKSRDTLAKKFNRKLAKWQAGSLRDGRADNGYYKEDGEPVKQAEFTKQILSLPWFIPAARFFYLLSNRTEDSGSMPEAVRRVISLPDLPGGWLGQMRENFLKAIGQTVPPVFPPELRETILARQAAYQPLVPASIARQIRVNKSIVKFSRSPREWSLENQTAPGSQRRFFNKETGQREIMQPGDWFGGDDATPGIAVCVPCTEVITPVSQKFGVLLGRFQWLAYIDCRTDKILAWDYVVRPRGSYRAEDILNGMDAVVRTHGVPRQGFQFEGGTFNSKLVRQAIQNLGRQHWRTFSPHQKAIEKVFDKFWTQFSGQFPNADMGRFRNENEENCKLYEECKAGHKDPRRYFPPLGLLLKAIDEEVAWHNRKPINSKQYGRWKPDDLFADGVQASPLDKYKPEMEWIFSPYSAERTVRGMTVSCRVPMFENYSVPFEFGADWLPEFAGKKVRLHFNPRVPKCRAKVVLVENSGTHRAGEVLGNAELVSETAGHIRYILEWSDDDQRAGYVQRQRVGNFIRRETRGVGAGGRVEYSKSEQRDGMGTIGIVQRGGVTQPEPETVEAQTARRLHDNLSSEETESARTERRAERLRLSAELEKQTAHLFI